MNSSHMRRWRTGLVLGVLVAGWQGGLPSLAMARESVATPAPLQTDAAFPSLLTEMPNAAAPIAPALTRTVEAFEAVQAARARTQQIRAEQDTIKTQLMTVQGELEVLGRDRHQFEEHLRALEQELRARHDRLQQELETRLEQELAQARQEIQREFEEEFAKRAQTFAARQEELVEKNLDRALQLQEQELEQLRQSLTLQANAYVEQLTQAQAEPELIATIQRSTQQLIDQRQAGLEQRRAQAQAERDAVIAKRRDEFTTALQQQQHTEQQRRLVLKEAGLRQAMAELLRKSHEEQTTRVEPVRRALDQARQRHAALQEQAGTLNARAQELEQAFATAERRVQTLEAERGVAIAKLEQAFQQPDLSVQHEAITWFGGIIHQLPTEMATELGMVHQRVAARAEQEQRLEEQRQLLRERQLALQVSRELERQHQLKQEQERQALAKKTQHIEALLAKSRDLAQRQQFDEALRLIAQAQSLNPPQALVGTVAVAHEEMVAAKEQAVLQKTYATLEAMFQQAMEAFERGQYEESIRLFEHVIAQESQLPPSSRLTSGDAAFDPRAALQQLDHGSLIATTASEP